MRLALAALLCSVATGALAQGCGPTNPNCVVPTAPFGDSTNKAASTAFVQSSVFTTIGPVVPENPPCNAVGSGQVDDSAALKCALNIVLATGIGRPLILTGKYAICPDGANPWGLLITNAVVIQGNGAAFGIPMGWIFPLASGCATPWDGTKDLIKIRMSAHANGNYTQLRNFTLGNALAPQGRNAIYIDTRGGGHDFGFAQFDNLNILPTANGQAVLQDNDNTEPTGGLYESLFRGGLYWNGITLHQSGANNNFLQVATQGSGIGIAVDQIAGATGLSIAGALTANSGGSIKIGQANVFTIQGGGHEPPSGAGSNNAIINIAADVGPVNGGFIFGTTMINDAGTTITDHIRIGAAANNISIGTNTWATANAAQIASGHWINNAGASTQIDLNQVYQAGTIPTANQILNTGSLAGVFAVANLPACNAGRTGNRATANNATLALTAGIGTIVAGGGANIVPVTCDGTNWRIG